MKINFQKPKQVYMCTKIPEELPCRIDEAVEKSTRALKEKNIINKQFNSSKKLPIWTKRTIKICASMCCCFIIFAFMVNINPSFAKNMENVPILGKIVNWLHVREINEENELDIIHAKIPNIVNTGHPELEEKINKKINEKIDEVLENARQEEKEIKQLFESYDKEYKFEPIEIDIYYEIKSENDGIISFIIIEEQSDKMHANIAVTKYMCNIDLEQDKELTLKDMLGENYKEIANKQIKEKIQELEKDESNQFFKKEDFPYLEHGGWFETVNEDQKFYINENGNVVIVFDKYEIAPGCMGMPEFEIIKPN